MKVKNEEGSGKKNADFIKLFEQKVFSYVLIVVYNSDINTTVADTKGKIWLWDDFEYGKGFSTGNTAIIKQNDWQAGWLNPKNDKKAAVVAHFQKAVGKGGSSNFYINNLSANAAASGNVLVTPADIAETVNLAAFDYKGFVGIVVFDFPSDGVIKHVIDQNSGPKKAQKRKMKKRK